MDTMSNKGQPNFEILTSDTSPDVDHGGKSADIPPEEVPGYISHVLTSSNQEVERPSVRSMKTFFEAMVKVESAKKFAANIPLEEETGLPIKDKGSRVRYVSHVSP